MPISLWVGHGANAESLARNERKVVRFAVVGPEGEEPLMGLHGGDPAAYLRPTSPGLHTLVYVGNNSYSELPAQRFHAYLEEEGLESVLDERRARGAADRLGRELYYRSLKALVWVSPSKQESASPPLDVNSEVDAAVGLPLELVLEEVSSEAVALRLLYRGEPLAGARVDLGPLPGGPATEPPEEVTGRTDEQGRLRLAAGAGRWLATAVWSLPIDDTDAWAPEGGSDKTAEWQTVWTALTFHIDG